MMRQFEIHCPECGEFRHNDKAAPKECPECGNPQVIALESFEEPGRALARRNACSQQSGSSRLRW